MNSESENKELVAKRLLGSCSVPSDKSIAHRALLFSLLEKGQTRVVLRTPGLDNFASIRAIAQCGVVVELSAPLLDLERAKVELGPLANLRECEGQDTTVLLKHQELSDPKEPIDCGNSGTTARLLCGLLSGAGIEATLIGDSSLSSRPFRRVTEPLKQMGAVINGERLPISTKRGSSLEPGQGELQAIDYQSPRASAQVKSAILLAALSASSGSKVREPSQSRDHTERLLRKMGACIREEFDSSGAWCVSIDPKRSQLKLIEEIEVPGDFSAAAFPLVAALIIPESEVRVCRVGINPSRVGLVDLLQKMGAPIVYQKLQDVGGEPVADLISRSSALRGVGINADEVVRAIDEIPILCVAAAFAEGETLIRGASELRVKESDRLAMIASMLSSFGVEVEEFDDGLRIVGFGASPEIKKEVDLSPWLGSGDHRIAMSAVVMQLACFKRAQVTDISAIDTSFPNFVSTFERLSRG